VRPVRQAAEIAERFADGHLDERMPVQGEDEVARLGESYNEMATSIQSQIRQLEEFGALQRRFTSDVSHELRTPLAVIQGATEILSEQTRDQPAAQKALTRLQRAASEMSEFIQALLMLSREAQAETEPGEFCDVNEIVLRVVEDQRELLGSRPVTLEWRCPSPLRVQAPGAIVTIVIGNLFRNAVAHTASGAIVCEIRDRTLEIRDSGPGIPSEHIEQVFDRNFTTRPGGHGVGLYLSKRICDRYGWQIALTSSSQGTTAAVVF